MRHVLSPAGHANATTAGVAGASNGTALVLTALLAGLRADELVRADTDVRQTSDAAVLQIRGKGKQ